MSTPAIASDAQSTAGKTILVVTNSGDLHADLVIERIAARGEPCMRLNLDRFPAEFALDLRLDGDAWHGAIEHLPSRQTLPVMEIGAVWTRKTADFGFANPDLGVQEKTYAAQETEHVLLGLLHSLDCYWMSHPACVRKSQWKIEQLQRATRMGFKVPASLVSTRKESVLRLRDDADHGIVFKALSSTFLGAEAVAEEDVVSSGIGTTMIGEEHLEMLDSVSELPTFFQHYAPKRYELRVTVIGERVFAARIHSQDDERTKIDFRDFSAPIRYEAEQLPAAIERRCADFVHSYGLNYGAIDLIFTPDGEYVFLENNPGGQFLFVEQLVPELKMLDAVADCLIEGAHRERRAA